MPPHGSNDASQFYSAAAWPRFSPRFHFCSGHWRRRSPSFAQGADRSDEQIFVTATTETVTMWVGGTFLLIKCLLKIKSAEPADATVDIRRKCVNQHTTANCILTLQVLSIRQHEAPAFVRR